MTKKGDICGKCGTYFIPDEKYQAWCVKCIELRRVTGERVKRRYELELAFDEERKSHGL